MNVESPTLTCHEETVLLTLVEGEPRHVASLFEDVPLSPVEIDQALFRLQKRGLIRVAEEAVYLPTASGQAALDSR